MKCMASSCVLIAANRQGHGLTVHEIAAKAELPLGLVQKQVWRICMANGVRLVRNAANTEALIMRICDNLGLRQQRSGVCKVAVRLVKVSEWGWLATGRRWVYVVAAAFYLAAQTYCFQIEAKSIAEVLYISEHMIKARLLELKKILLSLFQTLPWAGMVNLNNLHVYLLFVLENFEVLCAATSELRRRRLEAESAANTAPSSAAALEGRAPPLALGS